MFKTSYFLLVFFIGSDTFSGLSRSDQEVKPDSLRTLANRSNELACSQPERSFQYAKVGYEKALATATAQNRKAEIAIILNNMAFLAFECRNLELADTLLAKSILIKEKIGNLRSLGYAYWLKGKILSAENNLVLKEKLSDSLISIKKMKRIARSEFLFEQDSVLQANPYRTLGEIKTGTAIHWWLTGLALVSMVLLVHFYHRLSIKQKLLLAFDHQLTESREKQEKLKRKLLVYAENLANSDHKNKELMAQLERYSLARARQEALEALSRFRISKTEDLRAFRLLIEKVFPGYWEWLKEELPDLTENEQMIASLFKLGYTTQEMATVMGISYDGTKKARYRLKKKITAKSGLSVMDLFADSLK